MSMIGVIIVALAVAAAVWLVLGVLKGIARTVVGLLLVAAVVGLGVWIMIDANNLSQHFYQDDKLFILDIDSIPAGAFVLGSSKIPVPIGDLSQIKAEYPDLAKLKGSYYKVVVLDWSIVEADIDILNFKAGADEIRSALLSSNPRQLFVEKTSKALGGGMIADLTAQVLTMYPSNDFFASSMFTILAAKPLQDSDFMFAGIKNEKVIIYPETIIFKIIKLLPEEMSKALVPAKA
jgi:hypothetical protein